MWASAEEGDEPQENLESHREIRNSKVDCKGYVGPEMTGFVGPGAISHASPPQRAAL